MPDRRPPVPEILRGEVRDAGELAGGRHRSAGAAVADAGEHSPLGRAILERARFLDRGHDKLGNLHVASAYAEPALDVPHSQPEARLGHVDIAPRERLDLADV